MLLCDQMVQCNYKKKKKTFARLFNEEKKIGKIL